MKKLMLLLLLSATIIGCKKDRDYPQISFIGEWHSTTSNPKLQYVIKNITGEGEYFSALVFEKDGKQFLKYSVTIDGPYKEENTYLVVGLYEKQMILRDVNDPENKDIYFLKVNQ